MFQKKVCIFIWRVSWSRIPCREILDRMGIDLNSLLCPRCGEVVESIDHALVTCSEVIKIWELVGKWWKKRIDGVTTVHDLLQEANQSIKWVFLYLIWMHRNALVFSGLKTNLLGTFVELQRSAFERITRRATTWLKGWEEWLVDPTRTAESVG